VNELTVKQKFINSVKGINLKQHLALVVRGLCLVVLCIILSLINDNFFTVKNLINVLRQSTILMVVGLGVTAVLLTAGIDFSVGGVMALVGCLSALLAVSHVPVPLAVLIGLGIGVVFGVINGLLVGIVGLPPFVATYGMMWVANGLAMILMQGKVIFGLPDNFLWLGSGYISIIPIPVIIAAVLAILFHQALNKTVTGREIYAVGANYGAAHYSGIKAKQKLILVYVLSGLMAAVAGIIMTARLDAAQAGMGDTFTMQAIAAVVMGGTSLLGGEGGIPGTVIGALILTLVVNGLNLMGVSSMVHSIITGAVILIAVFFDIAMRKWSE
jgi:ribose transport system permease protein